jgi:predicted ATPase/transcriptional regulator with XRE-family HTH domain
MLQKVFQSLSEKGAMETFGEWLRGQRSERKLTREEFARRVGCSVAMLRKIEDGERRPSAQIDELIANALDIPTAERDTFIRVARGELGMERIAHISNVIQPPNISPAQANPHNNLPLLPTPLIGRQVEVEQLNRLLCDPQCRLLTLVGPGGIGKTRLAVEVAAQVQGIFANGVYFVPLASVSSIDAVIPTIANAVYFAFYGPSDPKVQLLNYLREKQILLVVDNVEHLLGVETVVELLVEIFQQAAQVKLLVTSRETLGMHDEWVFEVRGLPLPDDIHAEGSSQNTSVELFLQRARRAYVEFSATPEDYPAIVRICRLVDGNPLGIELAASWVRTLNCDEIASEIEGGLDFLAVRARGQTSNHHSLRSVFDHSWKLLTKEEQGILVRLSVFRGGFRHEAAESVTGATLSALSALLTKSLIRRSSAGRYDLHELIRQFAASNLAKNPKEMRIAQARHGSYYLALLEEQGVRLQSHQQKEAVVELTGDMDNIRAAWDWSIANHEFIRLYQVSARLMHLFEVRNWSKEAEITFRKTAEAFQASARESELDANHQVALHVMLAHWGFFQFRLGKGDEAYHILSPSAAFLQTSARPIAAVYALYYLGMDCCILGKFSEAKDTLQEGRELAREYGEHWVEAMDNEFLGRVAIEQGEYDQARQYLSEALAMLRQLGDPSMTAHALSYLGRAMQLLGEYREAEKLLRESLELSRENGYHIAIALALFGLGKIASVEGRFEEAQPLFTESARLFQEIGDTHPLSRTLYHRGLNSMAVGDFEGAENDFYTALNLAYKGGFTPATLYALTGLAALESRRQASQETFGLVLYIGQHPASTQEARNLAAQLQMELETKLSAVQIEAAEQNIALKGLDEFVLPFLTSFDGR